MTLNADLIRYRCREIEESLARLEQFQHLTKDQFLSNQDTLDIACYRLLIAIEAALALCFHVSATRLKKHQKNMRDVSVYCTRQASSLQIYVIVYNKWLDFAIC